MKKEIETLADIELLVTTFYKKMLQDEQVSHFFVQTNWEHHTPKIVDFWAFILLDKEGYKGNVFDVHQNRNIQSIHFELWLTYFKETVNELFRGNKAELAIQRAELLSYTFKSKMKLEN